VVALGASRTTNNRHLTGHAVDLAYWLDDGDDVPENGEIRWDWPSFPDGPHFELDRGKYP
jgi:peptidoglycan L-alanyl-D-glutamate endopeptidase CwlK